MIIIVLQSRNKGKRNNNLTIYFRTFKHRNYEAVFIFQPYYGGGGKSQFAFKKPNENPNPGQVPNFPSSKLVSCI